LSLHDALPISARGRIDPVLRDVEPALPAEPVAQLDHAQDVVGIGESAGEDALRADRQCQHAEAGPDDRDAPERQARATRVGRCHAAELRRNTIRLRSSQEAVKLTALATTLASRGSNPATSPAQTIPEVSASPTSAEMTNIAFCRVRARPRSATASANTARLDISQCATMPNV